MIKTEKRKSNSTDKPIKEKKVKFDTKNGVKKEAKSEKPAKAVKPASKGGDAPNKAASGKGGSPGKFTKGKPFQKGAAGKGAPGKFNKDFKGKKGNFKGKGDSKTGGGSGKGGGPVANASEKTDWNKFKQEKKELKLKRKKSKDLYEVTIEAKQIYEKLKCRSTPKKPELVEKLYNTLQGGNALPKLIMAHDTARIIQCMLKYASPSFREQISEKLLPLVVEMATSKYAHFIVLRMLKYGSPSTKTKLVDSLMGNVVRLACHTISSKILDHIYLTMATPLQKARLRQEFYGDLYKKSKDDKVQKLSDTYATSNNMKASILGAVKANLEHVINKNQVDNSLVHAIMLEYMQECEEDKLEETITSFAAVTPLMLTTKEGCQAAILCFYKAVAKNRRAIIKAIKEHLVKICTHEQGHTFILALLNSLDDTKATKKAIYDTVHPELKTLMANQWGRRVIEWLVAPGDTNFFHPSFIATLDEGLKYGKKDKEVRRKEIFEQIEEPIATAMAADPDFWLSDKHIGLVTAEILKRLTGDHFVKAASAIALVVAKSDWSVVVVADSKEKKAKPAQDVEKIIAEATKQMKKNKRKAKSSKDAETPDAETKEAAEVVAEVPAVTMPGIEEAGLHVVLKKIIKNDKERLALNPEAKTFGSLLVEQMEEATLKFWLTVNRGCFILLNVVENNSDATKLALKESLKPLQSLLAEQRSSGLQLLRKKLEL